MTTPDIYLWGFLKNDVFQERPTTRADMEDRIRRACAEIPRHTLVRTVRHFRRRPNLSLEANGDNFENFLRG